MGEFVLDCDETARYIHLSNDGLTRFGLYEYQVYREEQISASVNQITQTSGVWSNDAMQTVTNTNHIGQQVEVDGISCCSDEYRDEYYDEKIDTSASRLTGWTGIAEATWHLDSVYLIGSVILRTIDEQSQLEMKVIDSVNFLSQTCTLASESVDFRQLNYDCDAPGD